MHVEIPTSFHYNDDMSANVDMTYRFVWDSEPTDEQLLVIMQEVGEEARLGNEKIANRLLKTSNVRVSVSAPCCTTNKNDCPGHDHSKTPKTTHCRGSERFWQNICNGRLPTSFSETPKDPIRPKA